MRTKSFGKRRVVVTAGPTREHVDPVRYLSNESSGRMGFAIAEAAARAGHDVTLVAGPVELDTPRGVRRIDVTSAREMLAAARRAFVRADAIFMAAAVADWRPARRLAGKWREKDKGTGTARLDLVRNPDVLRTLTGGSRWRRGRRGKLVVAFALETVALATGGRARARRKMKEKGADFVVLNGLAALGGRRTSVRILGADGSERVLTGRSKRAVARALVRLLAKLPR